MGIFNRVLQMLSFFNFGMIVLFSQNSVLLLVPLTRGPELSDSVEELPENLESHEGEGKPRHPVAALTEEDCFRYYFVQVLLSLRQVVHQTLSEHLQHLLQHFLVLHSEFSRVEEHLVLG